MFSLIVPPVAEVRTDPNATCTACRGKKLAQPGLKPGRRHWRNWCGNWRVCTYCAPINVAETDAGQVWEDYVTLVRVENAFRTLKHGLALHPICHHREERAKAHVLFCWIAYAMYWVLERTHHQATRSQQPPVP